MIRLATDSRPLSLAGAPRYGALRGIEQILADLLAGYSAAGMLAAPQDLSDPAQCHGRPRQPLSAAAPVSPANHGSYNSEAHSPRGANGHARAADPDVSAGPLRD